MSADRFILGYLLGRRGVERWTGRERTRPKMPAGPWRAAAIICTAAGACVAWMIFRNTDAVAWRSLAGAAIGFVAGMYVVESIWERRVTARTHGPIGPRA